MKCLSILFIYFCVLGLLHVFRGLFSNCGCVSCRVIALTRFDGPTELDDKILKASTYCAVGGSMFDTVHDRVRGIKVPDTQTYQGNQWAHIVDVLKLKPDTVVISLGGNDCSKSDSRLKAHLEKQAAAQTKPTKGILVL